jgi:hypothetical protein
VAGQATRRRSPNARNQKEGSMIPGFPGPKDHWEMELEKVSKLGLIDLVEMLAAIYLPSVSRESWLTLVQSARKTGKFLDSMKQHDEMNDDPDLWYEKRLRKRASAMKAARRRKKESKSK